MDVKTSDTIQRVIRVNKEVILILEKMKEMILRLHHETDGMKQTAEMINKMLDSTLNEIPRKENGI